MISIFGKKFFANTTTKSHSIHMVGGKLTVDGVEIKDSGIDLTNVLVIKVENATVGEITTDRSVQCGDVTGSVKAGGSVNCDTVKGDVEAKKGSVNANDVGGSVKAGGNVVCDSVKGSITAGGNVISG